MIKMLANSGSIVDNELCGHDKKFIICFIWSKTDAYLWQLFCSKWQQNSKRALSVGAARQKHGNRFIFMNDSFPLALGTWFGACVIVTSIIVATSEKKIQFFRQKKE